MTDGSEGKFCSSCNKKPFGDKPLRRCGSCQSSHYCDSQCQKDHWPLHRKACKKLKEAKMRKEVEKRADALPLKTADGQDAVNVLINNERLTIARTLDAEDGHVYQQFMPKDQYEQYINATKPECWCGDVGQAESLLAVFAFDEKALTSMPKTSAMDMAKGKDKNRYLRSQYLSAFGCNFQLHVSEMMGNMSVCLSEERNSSIPLNTTTGVNCRATYWFVSGADGDNLTLPPPSKGKFRDAGKLTCNSHMTVWCNIGSKTSMGLHEIKEVPRMPGSAFASDTFAGTPPDFDVPKKAIAIAIMIEKVNAVASPAAYETATIQEMLHMYHSASVPDATVPSFCKQMCNKGLKFLNMKQPVNVIGCIPAAPATPATPAAPAAKPAPAAAAASSSKPSPGYTAPTGMENLSPGALSMLQEVMQGFQTGKHKSNPQYLMRQIEEALGDDELRPVLQNVLGNPQIAPLMNQMMTGLG